MSVDKAVRRPTIDKPSSPPGCRSRRKGPSLMSDSAATRRTAVERAAHLLEPQRARWLELIAQHDAAVDLCQVDAAVNPTVAAHLEQAQKLLGSTETKLVLCGATGAGKSTLINALLGRVVVPVAGFRSTTSVAITVRTIDATESERLDI